MSRADILLKKAIFFEKMAQSVLPLTNLPGQELQADPITGKGYYQNQDSTSTKSKGIPTASLSGPSSISGAQIAATPPTPSVQKSPAPKKYSNIPPEWLQKYMEQEKAKELAEAEIQRLKTQIEEMKNLYIGLKVKGRTPHWREEKPKNAEIEKKKMIND